MGNNVSGQLGNNQNLTQSLPLQVPEINNASFAATGNIATEVLLNDGTVVTFGANNPGIKTVASDMVFIDKGNSHTVLLSKDQKAYVYGNNSRGQLGDGTYNNRDDGDLGLLAEDVMGIAASQFNSYIVSKQGYVFGSGDNANGQLGDTTNTNSNVLKMMANSAIDIKPEELILEVGEQLQVSPEVSIFNVIYDYAQNEDYEYIMEENEFAKLNGNVITGLTEGTTSIKIRYKLSGAEREVPVLVLDPENNKVKMITVDGVRAIQISPGVWDVDISSDEMTADIMLETLNVNDGASIDGINYETNIDTGTVDVPNKDTSVTLYVKMVNDTVVPCILNIHKKSNIVDLLELKVNGITPTAISATEFEAVILEDDLLPEVFAKAKSEYAKIGIDGEMLTPIEATKNVSMLDEIQKIVPIVVESESGKREIYTLRLYKESILTGLEWVKVDGEYANQNGPLSYTAIVKNYVTEVDVSALAKYSGAKIYINGALVDSKTVAITGDTTNVQIKVVGDDKEQTYNLTIYRQENEANLDLLYVNGIPITPNGNVYETTLAAIADAATVRGISIKEGNLIDIAGLGAQLQDSTRVLNLNDEINTFSIVVTNSEDESEYTEYTLIIKKPSANTNLAKVTLGTGSQTVEAVKVMGQDKYIVKVNKNVTSAILTAIPEFGQASVKIGDGAYTQGGASQSITIGSGENIVTITVRAQDGTTKTYELEIQTLPSNTNVTGITVNGEDTTLVSADDPYTYEFRLDKIETDVSVKVSLEDILAEVAINNNLFEYKEITKQIEIIGKTTVVKIYVRAQDESVATYTLNIYGVSDNANISKIYVGEDEATLEPGTGRYIAKVNKGELNAIITAIAEDSKASVVASFEGTPLVNDISVPGQGEFAVGLTNPMTTLIVRITAQDGVTFEDYELRILEKSDNNNLGLIKVNGETVGANESGIYDYAVKGNVTAVSVYGLAEEENAKVKIGTNTAEKSSSLKVVSTPTNPTVIPVIVIAEDGKEQTYILNIRKMSNNVNILSLAVDGNIIDPYEYKVFNEEEVTVSVILQDSHSKVSINGELETATSIISPATATITVDSDEMLIPVVVTAEDGTVGTYTLKIVRASNDNTIATISIDGVLPEKIVQTGLDTYTAKIVNTNTSADISVITNHELADVKIAGGSYSTHIATGTVSTPNDDTDVIITVKAENGDIKTYTLTLTKVYDLGLEKIQVDGVQAAYEDGGYKAWTNSGTNDAVVQIFTKDTRCKVSIDGGPESTGTPTFNVPIDGTSKTVTVTITAPDGSESESYTLTITRKSNDTSLEMISVDGKTASLDEVTGKYIYTITVPISSEPHTIAAVTSNEYATVAIGENEAQTNTSIKEVVFEEGATGEVIIKVTAQDGTVEEHILHIIQLSNNNKLESITVNNGSPLTPYEDGKYLAFVDSNSETALLTVTAEHVKAHVKLGDFEEEVHISAQNIEISGNEAIVKIVITSEIGDVANYEIIIRKISTDAELEKISIGEKTASLMDEDTYYIKVPEGAIHDVTVKSTNQYANIKINNDANVLSGTNTVTVNIGNIKITDIPIRITAQDGVTYRDYILKIEQVSNDVTIKNVKVNGLNVTNYDEDTKTYSINVSKALETVPVIVELNNNYSSVSVDGQTGIGTVTVDNYVVSGDITTAILTVTAEDDTMQTYYLKIKKLSENSNIDKILLDGVELESDGAGNYTATVNDDDLSSIVSVISSNHYAVITINNDAMNTGVGTNSLSVDLPTKIVTIPIKVVSEDGTNTTNATITVQKISTNTKLEYVKAGGVQVEYDELAGVYKAFIPKSTTISLLEIKAASNYSTVQVEENMAKPTLTTTVETNDDVTTVTITVISEGLTSAQHTLVLTKISDDVNLEYVKVNNIVAGIKQRVPQQIGETEEGEPIYDIPEAQTYYYMEVTEDTEVVNVSAKTTSDYAKLKILDNEFTTSIQSRPSTALDSGKITEITITVKAQDDSTYTYKLVVEKVSSNANIQTVVVDDKTISPNGNIYNANITRLQKEATITITAENEYARIIVGVGVLDDPETGIGELTFTLENLDTSVEEISIPFTITSETGIVKNYILKLTRLSNETGIKTVVVNGIEIEESEDYPNTYEVPIINNLAVADIQITTLSSLATIDLNGEIAKLGFNETVVVVPKNSDELEVPVIITAQDGTTADYTILFRKLSGNSSITELTINEDVVESDENNIFSYGLHKGVTEFDLSILLGDSRATITIDDADVGKGFNEDPYENTIQISGDTSFVIRVTAEDGTFTTYTLNVYEISDDNTLAYVNVNGVNAELKPDGEYYATVDATKTSVNVNAVTTNLGAIVKVNDEEYENHTTTRATLLTGKKTEAVVTVQAQSGEKKEYVLVIERIYDITDITTVIVNGNIIVPDGDVYEAGVPELSDTANVTAILANEYAKVEIGGNENTGALTDIQVTLSTTNKVTTIPIIVTSEKGTQRVYTLRLIKQSDDNSLEYVLVNGIETELRAVETPAPTGETYYYAQVSDTLNDISITAKANDELAKVKLPNNNYGGQVQTASGISLEEGKITELSIDVKAEDGTTKTYKLVVEKISDDTRIKELTMNSILTSVNDEEAGTYEVFIRRLSTDEDIYIETFSPYAITEIGGQRSEGGKLNTTLTGLDLEQEQIMIPFTVTSESGIIKNYTLKLTRLSNVTEIEKVEFGNKELKVSATNDKEYIAILSPELHTDILKVTTVNEYSIISIDYDVPGVGYADKVITIPNETTRIEIPVEVTAQDGTKVQYTIVFRYPNTDNTIQTLKIDDTIVEKNVDEDVYEISVSASKQNVQLDVLLSDLNAYVGVGVLDDPQQGKIEDRTITLSTLDPVTTVPITVTAEDGTTKTYTLKITKDVDVIDIEYVKVNGVEVNKNAQGKYIANIASTENDAVVEVKLVGSTGFVNIAGLGKETLVSVRVVTVPDPVRDTTIAVTGISGFDVTYGLIISKLPPEEDSDEVYLDNLETNVGTLDPIFDKETNTYNILLENIEDVIKIKPTAEDENAIAYVNGVKVTSGVYGSTIGMEVGDNTIIVKVVLGSKVREYEINAYRKEETVLKGKVITANIVNKHIATIAVYDTDKYEAYLEAVSDNVLTSEAIAVLLEEAIVKMVDTNADGTFDVDLPVGKYDLIITKPGYLTYWIKGIETEKDIPVELEDKTIIAGDVDGSGRVNIDDLVLLNDVYGSITGGQYYNEKFDLNGDGTIEKKDRDMIKANYDKVATVETWVKPEEFSPFSIGTEALGSLNATFILPVTTAYTVTSEYGYRLNPVTGVEELHSGIDLAPVWHSNIVAVADGIVTFAGIQNGYGNCVEIKHIVDGKEVYTFYAHLSEIKVAKGDTVSKATVIGLEGGAVTDPNPGTSTGAHLHFEVRTASGSGHSVDPREYMKF